MSPITKHQGVLQGHKKPYFICPYRLKIDQIASCCPLALEIFSRTHLLRILRECHSHSPAEARSEAPPTRRLDQARKFWTTPLVHSSLDFVKPTSCPARHRNLLPSSNMKMKNERRGGGIEIAPAGCLQSSQPRVVATGISTACEANASTAIWWSRKTDEVLLLRKLGGA